MRWEGVAEFQDLNKEFAEEVRVAAARANMEAAKYQRDAALDGFHAYGIRMITGRSRALYAIRPGEGMFQPGATLVVVDVGYNSWPDYDHLSGGKFIEFYPWFLNYGTSYMKARPYHTNAMDETEELYYDWCYRYMSAAFESAAAKAAKKGGAK